MEETEKVHSLFPRDNRWKWLNTLSQFINNQNRDSELLQGHHDLILHGNMSILGGDREMQRVWGFGIEGMIDSRRDGAALIETLWRSRHSTNIECGT